MSDPSIQATSDFATLLWKRHNDLTPDAIAEHVVRPGAALGPIAIGEPEAAVLDRLDPERLPRGEKPEYLLEVHPEHHSKPGYTSGTVAYHITGHVPSDPEDTMRQCWLEWASDEQSRAIVQVRFCIKTGDSRYNDNVNIIEKLREAFEAQHGPGTERSKKHRWSRARPVDWRLPDGLLTLGTFDYYGMRYMVAELTSTEWAARPEVRIEPFR